MSKKKMKEISERIWLYDLLIDSALIQSIHVILMAILGGLQLLDVLRHDMQSYTSVYMNPYIYLLVYLISTVIVVSYDSMKKMRRIFCVKNITLFEKICILLNKLPLFVVFYLEVLIYIPIYLLESHLYVLIYLLLKSYLLHYVELRVQEKKENIKGEYQDLIKKEISKITGKEVVIK